MDAMSCLAPPPAASFLPTAASPVYYTDAAIARALHYSMSSDNHSHQYSYSPAATSSSSSPTSSSLLADLPFCSAGGGGTNWFADFAPAAPPPPTGISTTCDSVLVSSDAAPRAPPATATNKRRLGLGTASAGRAGKRRPRASKRAPTTYISTDPANFRIMVQHVTGVQAADLQTMPASFDASSAGMLDCPPPAFDSTAFGEPTNDDAAAAALHHRLQLQQQQQQPCFPTLDSWSVMYENSELL